MNIVKNSDCCIMRQKNNNMTIWTKNTLNDDQILDLFYIVDYLQRDGHRLKDIIQSCRQEEKEHAT